MSSVQKGGKAPSTKIQDSTTKQGKKAKKDASNKPEAAEKQPVKAKKPVKTTPAKEPQEKGQKKVHDAASSKGKKNTSGKPTKATEKQPGKVKTTPVKDERHTAQKRTRHSEEEDEAARQERMTRQIVIGGCPSATKEEDVKKVFPAAKSVCLVQKYGQFTGSCFVTFATSDEADAARQRKSVKIAGQAVTIQKPGEGRAARQERMPRQIVIKGCPSATKEEDVKKVFPAAEEVNLVQKYGRFKGTCFVTFATSDEADAARQRKDVTIAGQAVTIEKPGEKEAIHEEESKRKITLLNCPYGMLEEDVRKAFPKAQKVYVVGHFTGKCYVTFATRDEAVAASQKKIATIKDRAVHIYLDASAQDVRQEEDARRVVIRGCPSTTKKWDVKEVFPAAETVYLVRKFGRFTGTCFVTFVTSDEADAASQRKDVTIAGQAVTTQKPGEEEAARQERMTRQIAIKGCPSATKEEDVKKAFPEAESVRLVQKFGKFHGTCFVTFATSDEADAARQRKDVTIAGQAVTIEKPGDEERPAKRQKVAA